MIVVIAGPSSIQSIGPTVITYTSYLTLSQTLAETVSKAAAQFSAGRSDLLSNVLALLPALQATGVLQPPTTPSPSAPPTDKLVKSIPSPPPAFRANRAKPQERLDEKQFFDRFAKHVDHSGFRYREGDLKAFHLSVKCSDLTVLAGLSGVGKSSLVRLYTEALAGEDPASRKRLLTIDVSPAWTEPQDILGSVNLLDRRFEPAASGLFGHLISAAREYSEQGPLSGLVLVSLDEMNLAQVEHYFAGFIQAIERPLPREITVFDPSALSPEDPFRQFAMLSVPPTVRIVGTVNFDETTRPLSQRLKDRAAIIELSGERHAGLKMPIGGPVPVDGPPVVFADVQAWVAGDTQMSVEIATLIDELNPLLVDLGAPITARRANAIRRLFAGAGSIVSTAQILDIAISTRVLPLLRELHRPSARENAQRVLELLAAAPGACPDSCRQLSAMLQQQQSDWQDILEEK